MGEVNADIKEKPAKTIGKKSGKKSPRRETTDAGPKKNHEQCIQSNWQPKGCNY